MKKFNKRILSFFICFTLLLGIVVPNYVKANDTITIDLKTYPKMDIVLTTKNTNFDLSNFEIDIKNSLQNKGVNIENVDIQSIETTIVDTTSTDAQTIFKNWTRFPYNKESNWSYVSSGKYLTSSVNEPYETGFIDTSLGFIKDVTLSANLYTTQPRQPMGYIVRMQPQENNPNRYNMYMLWISAWDGHNYTSPNFSSTVASGKTYVTQEQRSVVLFKVEGLILDYNIWKNYATQSTYAATPLCQVMYKGEHCLGWPYHGPRNYGGYPDGTKLINGTTVSNSGDKDLKTTTLGWANIPLGNNAIFNMTLDVKGDTFKAYYNDTLLFTAQDSSYDSGYYGVFQFSHVTPKFYGINANIENYKYFNELLREPTWREDADHFIVNVDNSIDENFINKTSAGEILTRTINDDINFIQWGTNENKEIMENFISQNNGNGVFLNNDDYNELIEETANYIIKLYDIEESNDQYVIVNTPTDLNVNPIELATNTANEEYPNGKWIIHHNAKYFANSTGQSEYSEQYQNDLNIVFDKPGEYTIYYGEDLVKTIYAHRKPIANFSMSLNSDKTLKITNSSYDLDSNVNTYGLGNGIKETKWQWKNINDNKWQEGVPTSALTTGESYVVQLSVVDEQGVESTPTSKYITLEEDVKIPPIAAFSYANSTIFTNNKLEIIDTSYDPAGNTITTYSWVLKKDGNVVSTSSTPTLKFDTSTLGAGEYSYTLTVTNSLGLSSEGYTKSFTVIDDTIAPSVMIDPTYSDWGDSSAINFEFMDSGSGFAKFRYTHSDTQTPPSDSDSSWSAWSTSDNGSLTIQEDGIWYLHLQAYDNNNNLLTRTVGVYRIDTTNPVIESVSIDESSIEREIPITVVANDVTSGLRKNAYRFVNESTGEDSGYINSNVYYAKSNGVYTIYVKDQNNNEVSTQTREITFVDRVAPEILTFSTSTDQWATSVDTNISAKDTFSGMNTYSYALEKLNVSNEIVNNENQVAKINLFSTNVYAQDLKDVELIPIDVDNLDINSLTWQEDDTFNITENGTYNLYARDNANNVSAVQFTIDNIDTTAPTIEKIEKSSNDVTNGSVTITIIGANDNGVGLHDNPYSYDNGNSWTNVNTFVVNGNVSSNVLVRDKLENVATFSYEIDNIDKTLPTIEDLTITNNREERKSTIAFSITDDNALFGYALKNNSSLPNDSEYTTSLEVDDNGIASDEVEVKANGVYYLFIKDKAGNVYSQKVIIDALVTGVDITQNKVTEYQEVSNNNTSGIALFNTQTNVEGEYDTFVYVSQETTFSVVIPKVIILDGLTGKGEYQTSVIGNIAGVETIGIIPDNSFTLNDVDNVKQSITANVTQEQTSFGYSEIINKTTTNGSIQANNITAGSWKGIFYFNILVQNNQNTINSIASIPSDSFALVVDTNAVNIPSNNN